MSLHLPLTERSLGLLDRDALARMKHDAVIVNTSRGPIIDEDALIDARHLLHRRHHASLPGSGRGQLPPDQRGANPVQCGQRGQCPRSPRLTAE